MTVRTRFAPSPTGSLHVGGVRTALYCLLHARKQGGNYILRIEDTDQVRSTDEAERGILADLAWLELEADEDPVRGGPFGPYRQSERLDTYNRYCDQLLASGHAYEAWDSREELEALRAEFAARKEDFRYKQRPVTAAQVAAYRAEGRIPVVRLKAPDHDITVNDVILGDVTIQADHLEDIVIRKADGFPTYHFAVVVDDYLMQITQVLRGSEHLMNTPKHIGIQLALGWPTPSYGHLPIIMSQAGAKLSKRDKARTARAASRAWIEQGKGDIAALAALAGLPAEVASAFIEGQNDGVRTAEALAAALDVELPMIEVMDFRRGGYLPEALINFLALQGWGSGDDTELMSLGELIERFTIDRVGKTPARFDTVKLKWMNAEYMKSLPDARLLQHFQSWLDVVESPLAALNADQRKALLDMYRPRAATFGELDRAARFFAVRPTSWDEKTVQKHLLKGDGVQRLRALAERLPGLEDWSAAGIEAWLEAQAQADDGKIGKWAQPLRIAVSGSGVSPGIGETVALLGRDESLARVNACLAAVAR